MNYARSFAGQAMPSSTVCFTPVVFVVDDDVSVREALEPIIRRAGWGAATFASAREFLAQDRSLAPSCLILDLTLPDLNGLDLQQRIAAEGAHLPIIFITGYGDVSTSVRAMKAGAVDFLTKPFSDDDLLSAIEEALERSRLALAEEAGVRVLRHRYASLSGREREVMSLVVRGLMNRHVGGQLGISEVTVKAHRGNVMRKMRANSLVELVNMATMLNGPLRPYAGE